MMYVAIYKNNEGKFGAVLVEADEQIQAVKRFEFNNPDSELISLEEELCFSYYKNKGMPVIKTDEIDSIYENIEKFVFCEESTDEIHSSKMIAKIKNQQELVAFKLRYSIKRNAMPLKSIENYPVFITAKVLPEKCVVKSVETLEDIQNNNASEVCSLYQKVKNKATDMQQFLYGDISFGNFVIKITDKNCDFIATLHNNSCDPIQIVFTDEYSDVDSINIDAWEELGVVSNRGGKRELEALINNRFSIVKE